MANEYRATRVVAIYPTVTLAYFLEPGYTWTYCVLLRNLRSDCCQCYAIFPRVDVHGHVPDHVLYMKFSANNSRQNKEKNIYISYIHVDKILTRKSRQKKSTELR